MDNRNLRVLVRGTYDIQKLRIQMGNRIVGNFKAKLGQVPGEAEEEIDEEGKEILACLRASFKKITDGVKNFPKVKDFKGDEVISSYTELCLIAEYIALEAQEAEHFKRMGHILEEYPIYSTYLTNVKGIGPALAGVIISEIDITKARYPSSLWKYAGLDVVIADGLGRSRRTPHLEQKSYVDRDGNPATRQGITFNPFLKTKLIGVLGASFLRVKDSPYAEIYRDYKHRLESHPKWGTAMDGKFKTVDLRATKGHRHQMAVRYMVKRFLVDLYCAWRPLENLPVSPEYSEAKLGLVHSR